MEMLITIPELERLPWLAHGFTTRHGGVSRPPHASLNLSFSRPDDADAVIENRRRVCAALGVALDDLAVAGQVHGTRVAQVGASERGRGAREQATLLPAADGMVSDELGVVLLACFADCVPLLLVDPARRAVGVGHAGWRGTVGDMAGALVQAMVERYGSDPGELIAVVGPSIGPCCYEVGPEVLEAARAVYGAPAEGMASRPGGRLHFDLWAANEHGLRKQGVGTVVRCDSCSACQSERFFSHRAERGATGRFGALIGIRH